MDNHRAIGGAWPVLREYCISRLRGLGACVSCGAENVIALLVGLLLIVAGAIGYAVSLVGPSLPSGAR